jgi:hypothetical protein
VTWLSRPLGVHRDGRQANQTATHSAVPSSVVADLPLFTLQVYVVMELQWAAKNKAPPATMTSPHGAQDDTLRGGWAGWLAGGLAGLAGWLAGWLAGGRAGGRSDSCGSLSE